MTTREETLTRIRQALRTGMLPAVKTVEPTTLVYDQPTLIASFVREAQASGAEVFQPATTEDVVKTLAGLFGQAGPQAITWSDDELPIDHIRELLLQACQFLFRKQYLVFQDRKV